ncbi:YlxR family protein [Gordonia sp. NPDC003424]
MVQQALSAPGPVRMCVGCRQRADRAELVRVVVRQENDRPGIAVDLAKTMPGRGAWLHPRTDCMSAAVRRKAFGSALRVPGLTVDPDDLAEAIGGITVGDGHDRPEQVAEDYEHTVKSPR